MDSYDKNVAIAIALIQLTSGSDIATNIARIEAFVKKAAGQGAQLAALPENAFYMGEPGAARPLFAQGEHPAVVAAARMAKENGVWLLAGSIAVPPDSLLPPPLAGEGRVGVSISEAPAEERHPPLSPRKRGENPIVPADDGKTYNRSLLFDREGGLAAWYDKIHLFDVTLPDGEVYAESARFLPGTEARLVEIDIGAARHTPLLPGPPPQGGRELIGLGMTVCYDVRFPHLYRALAKAGAQIIAVPSAFTVPTGEAHWHALLRARAIENGCFIIAPAQTGMHPGGRKTYGHSLIIDPWGRVLADGGTEEGIVMAEIDLDRVKEVRGRIPSLQHDREFTLQGFLPVTR